MGHEEMQSTVCRLADGMQQEACPWKKENRNFTNRCADAGCFVKKPVGVVSYGRGAVITSGTVAVSDAAFRTGSVDRNSCNLCGDSGTFRLACRKRNAGSALFMGTFDRESVFLCAGSFDFDSQSRSSGCRKSLFYYTDDLQRRGNAGRDAQLTPGEGQRRGS